MNEEGNYQKSADQPHEPQPTPEPTFASEPPPEPEPTPFTPPATTPPPMDAAFSSEEKLLALLCHLIPLLGAGFIGPLVIWLIKKDQSAYIDHHAKEALNFQLTLLIAILVCFLLTFVVIGVILAPVVGIIALIWSIMACIAANDGKWYRYPVSIRFIP